MSDGDINLNIDRTAGSFRGVTASILARPLRWTFSGVVSERRLGETEKMCAELKHLLTMHKAELKDAEGDSGVWLLVKITSEMLFGIGGGAKPARDEHEIQTIRNNIQHIKNHLSSVTVISSPAIGERIRFPGGGAQCPRRGTDHSSSAPCARVPERQDVLR